MKETTFDAEWIHGLMRKLACDRRIFHNEGDFRQALVRLLHQENKGGGNPVFSEYPLLFEEDKRKKLDIWFEDARVAIELKYLTKHLAMNEDSKPFVLLNHSAHNQKRYDVLRDVQKLEDLCAKWRSCVGYVVFLTNDPLYWDCPPECHKKKHKHSQDRDFHLYGGRKITNTPLMWKCNAKGEGPKGKTIQGRDCPIFLTSPYHYVVSWQPYSDLEIKDQPGTFKYLALQVLSPESKGANP